MPDPVTLSLASLGAVTITEGIKFLYSQAGELLKRWRERGDKAEDATELMTFDVNLPAGFSGESFSVEVPAKRIEDVETALQTLRGDLLPYVDGKKVTENNERILTDVDRLRSILETLYQRRLTLIGEDRPPSGSPVVVGDVDAEIVAGDVSGVDAEEIGGKAKVIGTARAGVVVDGGSATGVKAGRIG